MWCSARDGPLCTYYNLNIPRGRSIQAALTCVHPNVPAPPPVPVHPMCRVTYLLNWYLAQGRPGSNELLTNRIIEINEPALWLHWPMCQVSHSLSLSVIKSPFSWQGWLLALGYWAVTSVKVLLRVIQPTHQPWNSDKDAKIWRKQISERWSLHTLTPL